MILLKDLIPEAVKIKKLPTSGWDKDYGYPDSYSDFGGSGFKRGKDWTYGPRGKETKIGQGRGKEEKESEKETGYRPTKELKEDWFDDYMKYTNDVIDELRKRFKINTRVQNDLISFFGGKIEKGFKKNISPKKLAYVIIPRGHTFKLHRFGNA
jgi:hypothetical protein